MMRGPGAGLDGGSPMHVPSLAPVAVSALLLSLLPNAALAGDGVLEINQICAVQTGCFAGDTAGLPVTITASGSYRLTSNLPVPNENTDGILVSTSSVSIDLAGFEIAGPVVCAGSPLACAPATGTGSGVERTLATNRGISVRNGTITGMGTYGVRLAEQAEATNLRVRSNGIDGIQVGNSSIVSGNTAQGNGRAGILAGNGSTISGNTAQGNGEDGIVSNFGSTVSGNTTFLNEDDGMIVGSGSTISGNTAYQNGNDGIQGTSACTIIGNTAYDNGDSTSAELDDGIECSAGCIARSNSLRLNSGVGLNLSTDSAYSDNVVTGNATGTVAGTGSPNSRGGNYCAGPGTLSAFCP